jgi:hypothetical protein
MDSNNYFEEEKRPTTSTRTLGGASREEQVLCFLAL